VVRDEVLSPLDNPREVTDTQLVSLRKRRGHQQPSRISESLRPPRRMQRHVEAQSTAAKPFGHNKIETEKVTAIVGHHDILTSVDAFVADWTLSTGDAGPTAVTLHSVL